jgi:hypothetical protein
MKKRLLLLLSTILLLILAVAAYGYAREGLRHIEPARALRLAQQDWQAGRRGVSVGGHIHAYAIALEAGIRWEIARADIDRMMIESQKGQLDGALRACGQAVVIVAGYDDEGSLSSECFAIEADIRVQNELRQ